jgi:hypothetical protein
VVAVHRCSPFNFLSIASRTCLTWVCLRFTLVVLDVDAWAAGPGSFEDGVAASQLPRFAEVLFADLHEIGNQMLAGSRRIWSRIFSAEAMNKWYR